MPGDAVGQAGCIPAGCAGSWPGLTWSHLSLLAAWLYFCALFPFQLLRFQKGRQCLGNWKQKTLKEKSFWWWCELWIYSTYLLASVHVTTCQHLMYAIHFGHLLSSLKVRTLQVTMLTASIFYRNAHSSGICFSSRGLALFLWKLLAILVTEQEEILLCNMLNEWRIRPLQNIWFPWWLYWGEQSEGIWNLRVPDSSTNTIFIFNGIPLHIFFICLLLFKDNSLRIALSSAKVS